MKNVPIRHVKESTHRGGPRRLLPVRCLRWRFGLLLGTMMVVWLAGCQEATSYETFVSLLPPVMEQADPNVAPIALEPIDPLDVQAAVEKIAGKAGLKPYSTDDDEASLLDIADADLSEDAADKTVNVTEWKHPDLPVYLTVTRKTEEILLLLYHTPDAAGKANPDAAKLHKRLEKQLADAVTELRRKSLVH